MPSPILSSSLYRSVEFCANFANARFFFSPPNRLSHLRPSSARLIRLVAPTTPNRSIATEARCLASTCCNMINTQPLLSQFHLPNASAGTGHHYLSDKRQHQQQIHHKHSQSLDANGPYIAISECHSGKSFMQKQQQPKATTASCRQPAVSSCALGQDRLTSTNLLPSALSLKPAPLSSVFHSSATANPLSSIEQLSIYNNKQQITSKPPHHCESKVFLHARSSSNIVLGSKKQYAPIVPNSHLHHHLNSSSTIGSTPAGSSPAYCLLSDKPTNRHFKIYEKNELANSTSLIDVSLSSCLGTSKCDCNCNKNFVSPNFSNFGSSYFINSNCNSNYSSVNYNQSIASHLKSANQNYLQRSINSTNKQWNTSSLEEKFDNLSLSNLLSSNGNYLNCNQISNLAPPRPPKPVKLRIGNQITDQLSSSSTNNSSFNESFSSNNFILPSDEEYSPTSSKLYGSYKFSSPGSQSQHQRPPKNSLSSSCSSNASPFYNSNSNAADSVFVYDQNQLNISNFQSFHHSPSLSRLNSFEDTDSSENSPTYLNNSALINLNNLSISNQTSPSNYNLPCVPPAVNRNLKPRKNLSNQLSSSSNR